MNLAFLLLFCSAVIAEAGAWQLSKNFWTEEDEKTYQKFVARLGKSKYHNLTKFIRDPKVNPLYGNEDKKIRFYPDCADLPYMIRAYVAYKLRLPFSYVSEISSGRGDERYSSGNFPKEFKDQDCFSSPQKLFYKVALVNSGYYRMNVKRNDSDFYPIKLQRESIKPGTVYYDPNGHVAIVYNVTDDGHIKMIDAHPDKSISRTWFGTKFSRGNKQNGGGFKKWRPVRYLSSGKISRSYNYNIADYSGTDQFKKVFSYKGQANLSYYYYIRKILSTRDRKIKPVEEFEFMMRDIYEDIKSRAVAVDICLKNKINLRKHPGVLPKNIYGTFGIWEKYSTPSRDARLKVAFRDFYLRTIEFVKSVERNETSVYYTKNSYALANELLSTYLNLSAKLKIHYINSEGKKVALNFDDILHRLFKMSFDPYHSPELRWGASGNELKSANDSNLKKRMYAKENNLRNQLARVYNKPTPFSFGPSISPNLDIKKWLYDYVSGKKTCIDPLLLVSKKPNRNVSSVSQRQFVKKNQDALVKCDNEPLISTESVKIVLEDAPKTQIFDGLSDIYKKVYLSATDFQNAIPVRE